MKIWRLCFPVLICSGLCLVLWLSGCGDNPCEAGDPDTCANIPHTAPNSCFVIEEEDFACKCCNPDTSPCPGEQTREFAWDENSHTCLEQLEE
jgi:hypothetical protein